MRQFKIVDWPRLQEAHSSQRSSGRGAAAYGLGCAELAGLANGAFAGAEAEGAAGGDVAVDCGMGFTFALASAAAFCAAALAGSGAAAFDAAEVRSNSRRTAELCVPRCA